MSEEEIRLEAIRLALQHYEGMDTKGVFKTADVIVNYIKGEQSV